MKFEFLDQAYGKSRVRMTRVHRRGDVHELVEFTCEILLDGDFERSYSESDNSLVVPTDTIKNTVYVLARNWDGTQPEDFAQLLAQHFLNRYSHVTISKVTVVEHLWNRIAVDGKPHAHSFVSSSQEKRGCTVAMQRDDEDASNFYTELSSWISDLVVLKTTQSGFSNYWKDEFTTLKDTDDRIFATSMTVRWDYLPTLDVKSIDFKETYNTVRNLLLREFTAHFSPSVQRTIYEMATAILTELPEVNTVELLMPNQHRLLANLAPFNLDNPNAVFVATDEPHGTISAKLGRKEE